MEELIEALKEANKTIRDVNSTLDAIIEDMKRIGFPMVEGNERDNKNEDSNFEPEQ